MAFIFQVSDRFHLTEQEHEKLVRLHRENPEIPMAAWAKRFDVTLKTISEHLSKEDSCPSASITKEKESQ